MERKLATVLFVDLVDSTSLVTRADPEVVRRRVTRYFELASDCIEAHGGTVEKFAGDAVMAAFGVPLAHEDDTVRAVRAALAIRDGVRELDLEVRAGVEAGEILVDSTQSTFATGEAVNVAARLQQAAPAGTVALGPGARRLTLSTVEVEEAGPVEVAGRGQVWSWRALRVLSGRRRRSRARFVGRQAELDLLRNVYERAVRGHRTHLLTVVGEAGVGKSRLVSEFADAVERTTVLTGRALPYGEGVGFWPIASMVKASAGITDDDPAAEAFEKLRVCCESEAVADLLGVALGVLGAAEAADPDAGEEIAWAALRWAEQLAEAQPLVLVFEDLQWADDPLLDVIEHLSRSLKGVGALIVCVARGELLERRSGWGGGNPRAAAIEVEQLSPEESAELADELLPAETAPPALRARALEQAEGNPLFLEETARMLLDDEAGDVVEGVPDSIQTLIAARIDLLDPEAKRTLQAASVIGRVFWRGTLERLLPELAVDEQLDRLLERELIVTEERSAISGDHAFRFRHGLIGEVAYATLTKAERARLHRLVAAWVADRVGDDPGSMRARQLECATTLLQELDGSVEPELAAEAAAALQEAGERALRGDRFAEARRLLLRAVDLEPTPRRRYLAGWAAFELGDLGALAAEAELVREEAAAAGDAFLEGRALVALSLVAIARDGDVHASEQLAGEALETFPEDEVDGRFDALFRLSTAAWWPGDVRRAETFVRQALELAETNDRADLRSRALRALAWLLEVRLELDEAEDVIASLETPGGVLELARTRHAEGSLLRMQGRLDEAAARFEEARSLYLDAGITADAAWSGLVLGWIAYVRGDLASAERDFREGVRVFGAVEDHGRLCESERALAEVLAERGRLDEAERLALAARGHVSHHDLTSSTATVRTLGLVRAAQGRDAEAEELLRDALSVVEGTECTLLELPAVVSLARFLRGVGREREADELEARLPERVPGWLNEADRRVRLDAARPAQVAG